MVQICEKLKVESQIKDRYFFHFIIAHARTGDPSHPQFKRQTEKSEFLSYQHIKIF